MKNATKPKRFKIFLFFITVNGYDQDYKPGDKFIVPVKSWSAYHAEVKFMNEREGVPYTITKIIECDKYQFSPMGITYEAIGSEDIERYYKD